ncbi:GNAT family N-acetyltransferase [Anabaena cylindrica UHCC 0172]|uniref:GNAT family N-acetyltransferase n=1 Tax=Anabaena cylindrica TaxID=1165 RepID=UPI002B1EC81B|nr:GNAT family N-acetyltransferase [Anabaena cylindrica]MEA5553970.1 GNAT family N-acetyltransferase [Anabaena cylindrica UHCC 0172]
MNNSLIRIEKLLDTDLDELRKVSQEIWYAHYSQIISIEQIEYMLNLMYGVGVIENEILNQGIFYDKVLKNDQVVGYLSYGTEIKNNIIYLKLHKCYLLPSLHGLGYGQIMLNHIYKQAENMNLKQIILNVNKGNEKGIKAYTRFGFRIIASEIKDIGGRFVMDDYIMGYDL